MGKNSQKPAEKATVQTLLTLQKPLYARVKAQADADRRTVRPEIEVLLEEAVAAREARK